MGGVSVTATLFATLLMRLLLFEADKFTLVSACCLMLLELISKASCSGSCSSIMGKLFALTLHGL